MVTGTRDDIIKVKNYVKKIDQKAPQIVVEALIVNITHKKSKNPIFNIQSQSDASGKNTIFKSNLGKLTYNSITNLPSEFYVELQSMIEKGEASVRANPNVTTLNGHEANIEVSDVKYYETSHENSEGKKKTEYKSLDVGVSLSVTPWVSNSGGITLDLKPEVSSLSTKTGPKGEKGPPDIIRRQASTTVRVNNGETIVLGGLMRNSNKQASSKVPILGDIPLIGNLFRRKTSSVDKTELVIYITPYILKKKKKNNEVSMQEMLKKAKKVNVD